METIASKFLFEKAEFQTSLTDARWEPSGFTSVLRWERGTLGMGNIDDSQAMVATFLSHTRREQRM